MGTVNRAEALMNLVQISRSLRFFLFMRRRRYLSHAQNSGHSPKAQSCNRASDREKIPSRTVETAGESQHCLKALDRLGSSRAAALGTMLYRLPVDPNSHNMTPMATKRILVTGGSGKAGHWIVKHFVEEGYDVVNVDTRRPAVAQCRTIVADLTQLGQVVTAFSPFGTGDRRPYDGVIHMAAIPRAHESPNDEIFRVNALGTYNVLEACAVLNIAKAVIASSESSYGICFASEFFEPKYLPIDEAHPQLPEDSYGLTKVVNEVTAASFHRRTGMQIVPLRLGNILSPEDHAPVRARFDHPEDRLRILWSYIDARDVAIACRLRIEKDGLGCEPVILAADDTSSDRPSQDLIRQFLPGVTKFKQPITGRQALITNRRAKALLGWKQKYFLLGKP
jgi:nucleoside-diphosphate-sugar epimerase